MPKWGSTDFEELKRLQLKINQAANADFDVFCVQMSKELAARFLAKVKKRTPVGVQPEQGTLTDEEYSAYWGSYTGGTLRRGWTIGDITRKPNGYEVEIINPVEYASYVEFGHRQTPGRYVPQIGKKLKRAWSPGKFMMTFTEQEIQSMAPAMIQKKFEKFLREVMSGDK